MNNDRVPHVMQAMDYAKANPEEKMMTKPRWTYNPGDMTIFRDGKPVIVCHSCDLDAINNMLDLCNDSEQALAVGTEDSEHTGERCQKCGRGYDTVWTGDSDAWENVVGSQGGLLCPMCFDLMCREKAIYLHWYAYAKDTENLYQHIIALEAKLAKCREACEDLVEKLIQRAARDAEVSRLDNLLEQIQNELHSAEARFAMARTERDQNAKRIADLEAEIERIKHLAKMLTAQGTYVKDLEAKLEYTLIKSNYLRELCAALDLDQPVEAAPQGQ